MPWLRCRYALVIVGLALVVARSPAAAAPEVVASVAPIHSLVAAVMAGVGEPKLLVPPGASPHAYSLRPSEARALAGADIVFRVGPGLETFLDKPLAALVEGTSPGDLNQAVMELGATVCTPKA